MFSWSANISILFTELPFLKRFQAAADNGFSAVEMWFPYDWPIDVVAAHTREAGLPCVAINAPPGDIAQGDFGFAAVPSRRRAFIASIAQALEYADALNARAVHVLAGMHADVRCQPAENPTYMEHMREAAALCAKHQKTMLIEPLNAIDRPGYLMSRQAEARAVVDALGLPNVKIMYDLYHAQMSGEDLVENLRLNWAILGHVQIADAPGRHEPGTGQIDFHAVFAELQQRQYRGFIGCEYKPAKSRTAATNDGSSTPTADGLGWMRRLFH
jgi:hydroxypyruvate isomerase